MNRYQELFGDIDKTLETIGSMGCLDPDNFKDCEGCRFWEISGKVGDPCPQYKAGIKLGGKVPLDLAAWLAEEA